MTKLESQIRELSPSVKDALFRRLMFAEDLAWLREENKKGRVIGFEVDLDGQELSGFALIAIQRHTVIAFVSDRDESPRLILFPSLEMLFDPGFDLLNLIVTRKEFVDAAFNGTASGHGRLGDMVKDLTPPNRKVDISDTVMEQIAKIIETEEEAQKINPEPAPVSDTDGQEPGPGITDEEGPGQDPGYEEGPPDGWDEEPNNFDNYEEPGYDGYENYQEPGYDEYEDSPAPPVSRSDELKAQTFNQLSDVTDFVVTRLGIDRSLAVTLVNKAMQSKVSPQYRVQLAVNIFCKLMDENKI